MRIAILVLITWPSMVATGALVRVLVGITVGELVGGFAGIGVAVTSGSRAGVEVNITTAGRAAVAVSKFSWLPQAAGPINKTTFRSRSAHVLLMAFLSRIIPHETTI
jgi:hypothetical protein